KGTGLGLSTVHAIVRRSRGGIAVESEPGRGTTFRVYLPWAGPASREEPAPTAPPEAEAGEDGGGGGGMILLVEDDERFRGLLELVLENAGYQVLAAANPAAALELAPVGGDGLDLLLSDMIMPGGTGVDLARQLGGRHPAMKIILMSGYDDDVL